jgi:hypothetical protein
MREVSNSSHNLIETEEARQRIQFDRMNYGLH